MLLFILLIVFVCALSSKKSKPLALFIMTLTWALFAFNYDNPDYENYVAKFNNVSSWFGIFSQGISDVGFGLIMRWFYVIGVPDYYHFKIIVSGILLLSYFYFSTKNIKYCAYWSFLYFTFYAILDVTQFRNFVGFSLVMTLFPLLEKDNLKSIILFLIGVFFASTIHFSMSFFLIMGLRLVKKKHSRILLIALSVVAIFTMRDSLFGSLQESSYYNKVDDYTRTSMLGALVTTTLFVAN